MSWNEKNIKNTYFPIKYDEFMATTWKFKLSKHRTCCLRASLSEIEDFICVHIFHTPDVGNCGYQTVHSCAGRGTLLCK